MYPGDYILVDIGSHHAFKIQNSKVISIEFTSEAISKHILMCDSFVQLLEYPTFAVVNTPDTELPIDKILYDDTGYLLSYINLMNTEINSVSSDSSLLPYIIKHHMIAVLFHIMLPFYEPELPTTIEPMVQKMVEIIALHYSDSNPLAIASKELSYSPSTLSTLFKNNMGSTFKEYLQRFRIEKAKRLLFSTNMKITTIAQDVGYSDIKFFSKIFKDYEGMTPTEYRRLSRYEISCLAH